jgi:hypothetical protein
MSRLSAFVVVAALITACSSGEPVEAVASADSTTDDGPPVRLQCTDTFGAGLSGTFGRLDGILVAVVPPGHGGCRADRHHVHLQVRAQGEIYDVAVNVDGGFLAEHSARLPGTPWTEGWHRGGTLDYASDFGLHAGDFTANDQQAIDQRVESVIAQANHVSIYATLFDHSGVHLVHRRGQGTDGAVVLDPLSENAHVLAFRFDNQSF